MSSFRFHKFTDEEEDKNNNFYNINNSNIYNQRQSFNNGFTNSYNTQNFKNSINNNQSYYKNNNNLINSNSNIKISINYNDNKLINLNSNNINNNYFPFDEIKSLDFLLLLKNGKFNSIEKYLPQMLSYDFTNSSKNPQFPLVIKNFQIVLNYLFNIQEKIQNQNLNLENYLNDPKSDINKRKTEIENKIEDINFLNMKNDELKQNLQKKIAVYKSILLSTGNANLLPYQVNPIELKDEFGNYYCDICPNKKFSTYKEVHKHYVKRHLNLDKIKGNNIVYSQSNFEKYYFDNKLDMMKNELKNTILELNRQKSENFESKQFNNLKDELNRMNRENQNKFQDIENQNKQLLKNSNKNNSIQINKISNQTSRKINFNELSNNDLNEILIEIQNQQNEQFNSFNNEFEKFKYDVLNQLYNLSRGKNKTKNMEFNLPPMKDDYQQIKNMDSNNNSSNINIVPLNHKKNKNNKDNYEENSTTILRNTKYTTINNKKIILNNNDTRKFLSNNDEKLVDDMLKNEPNSYERNKVIERGTNLLKNSLYKPNSNDNEIEDENIIQTNVKNLNDDNFENSQQPQRLRAGLKNKKTNELENIYDIWNKRENNILFNPQFKTVSEKQNRYKIFNTNDNSENVVNILLNEKERQYNFDFNNTNDSIKNYCDVINQIFNNYLKDTDKKGKLFGKYKDNALSMTQIEDFIENIPELKNDIYGNNNVDKIYDYLNYVNANFSNK